MQYIFQWLFQERRQRNYEVKDKLCHSGKFNLCICSCEWKERKKNEEAKIYDVCKYAKKRTMLKLNERNNIA